MVAITGEATWEEERHFSLFLHIQSGQLEYWWLLWNDTWSTTTVELSNELSHTIVSLTLQFVAECARCFLSTQSNVSAWLLFVISLFLINSMTRDIMNRKWTNDCSSFADERINFCFAQLLKQMSDAVRTSATKGEPNLETSSLMEAEIEIGQCHLYPGSEWQMDTRLLTCNWRSNWAWRWMNWSITLDKRNDDCSRKACSTFLLSLWIRHVNLCHGRRGGHCHSRLMPMIALEFDAPGPLGQDASWRLSAKFCRLLQELMLRLIWWLARLIPFEGLHVKRNIKLVAVTWPRWILKVSSSGRSKRGTDPKTNSRQSTPSNLTKLLASCDLYKSRDSVATRITRDIANRLNWGCDFSGISYATPFKGNRWLTATIDISECERCNGGGCSDCEDTLTKAKKKQWYKELLEEKRWFAREDASCSHSRGSWGQVPTADVHSCGHGWE